jgi:alanyl-tRNA synthetase
LRIYYTDSLLTTFEANVVSCDTNGEAPRVVLDRTAFYPTSGGQPHDLGSLGDARVLDVIDEDDHVVHVVDRPLRVGAPVAGRIDWARRFDHMQQHTGQHILSAAFDRTAGVRTESFHLGTAHCTIDLAREVSAREIAVAEDLANAVVWEDRPVTVRFVSEDEAAALPLRKESLRTGTLRLVDVTDFDLSACGGTHVPTTGRIGIIAVSGVEKVKGGTRVSFVCGGRALASHRAHRDRVDGLVRLLTVGPDDLRGSVERLQGELRTQQKTIKDLQSQVATSLAESLRATAESTGSFGHVAVVIGSGSTVPVVVARSSDVSFAANVWLTQATSVLGGKGGGRPELAQGALSASPDAILAFARETVR